MARFYSLFCRSGFVPKGVKEIETDVQFQGDPTHGEVSQPRLLALIK